MADTESSKSIAPESGPATPPPWLGLVSGKADRLILTLDLVAKELERCADGIHHMAKHLGLPAKGPGDIQGLVAQTLYRQAHPQAPVPPSAPPASGHTQPASGPPPGYRAPTGPSPRGSPRRNRPARDDSPQVVLDRIRRGVDAFPGAPLEQYPVDVIWEPNHCPHKPELDGQPWVHALTSIPGLEYALWRVRKEARETVGAKEWTAAMRNPQAFEYWNWEGTYAWEALRFLWMLKNRDYLLAVFRAGQPVDAGPTGDDDDDEKG